MCVFSLLENVQQLDRRVLQNVESQETMQDFP